MDYLTEIPDVDAWKKHFQNMIYNPKDQQTFYPVGNFQTGLGSANTTAIISPSQGALERANAEIDYRSIHDSQHTGSLKRKNIRNLHQSMVKRPKKQQPKKKKKLISKKPVKRGRPKKSVKSKTIKKKPVKSKHRK